MKIKALSLRVVAGEIANSSTNSLKIGVVNATSFIKLAFEKTTNILNY